jgi:hypothetical protein
LYFIRNCNFKTADFKKKKFIVIKGVQSNVLKCFIPRVYYSKGINLWFVATICNLPEFQPTDYVNDRQLNHLLVHRFGEKVMFSCPKENNKSRQLSLSSTQTLETVNKARPTNVLKVSADLLREVWSEYKFNPDNKLFPLASVPRPSLGPT